ncbi:MAG: MotA/TolQ/ExbB proton channel family protein [Sulfuricella sp.]|nr:MotA/TolQ/ExbB proton channel family protein [Sulfuricella sp.]
MLGITTSPIVAGTLWLLVFFSVVSWTLIVVKGWTQWRLSKENRLFCQAFWNAKGLGEAEKSAAGGAGPLARLADVGFKTLHGMRQGGEQNLQHSGDQQDILERSLRSQAQKELHRLESGLMVLASIGSTAPFVGLFGTVWGIMHALSDISKSGSAGLDVVAGPIGEALIATAIGIATAIPAVLAYNYGLRRVKLYAAEMEHFATDLLHLAMKSGFRVE